MDSIRYISGLKHIYIKGIYHTSAYHEPFSIIEGIGSNLGPIWKHKNGQFQGSTVMVWPYLICSHKNGNKTPYVNKYYAGTCYVFGNVNGLVGESDISTYPVPASGIINIKNNTNEKINKVQIISQAGQLVKELTSLEITSVEIGEIPAGYYYLKLYTGNGYVTVKPMVVR